MARPKTLRPFPALALTSLGGLVGILLHTVTLFLAPVLGLPFVDVPRLTGGVFVASPDAAFWLGFALQVAGGVLVLGPLIGMLWSTLPGRGTGFPGALLKGVIWGIALAIVSGLLLPLLGAINRVDVVGNPGVFALSLGAGGAIVIVVANLLFALSVAIIAAMPEGISPAETIGLPGHYRALQPPDPALLWDDAERLPRWPFTGSR